MYPSQLALKHRQNKSQRQRIIIFTCSRIIEDQKALTKLAKRMKKYAISVDFIAFGDLESETKAKLEAFNENVKGGDGSHLVFVPPGPNLLSDVLLNSPILAGERGGSAGAGAGGQNEASETGGEPGTGGAGSTGFEFGIDPSVDPELAMALRMSMEEETHRLERQRREREEAEIKEKEDQEKERLEGIPEEAAPASSSAGNDTQALGGEGTSKPSDKAAEVKKEEPEEKMDIEKTDDNAPTTKEHKDRESGDDGGDAPDGPDRMDTA